MSPDKINDDRGALSKPTEAHDPGLPTLLALVQRSAAYLTKHGISNARREAEWIFSETLSLTRMELYTRFDMPLAAAEVDRLRALVSRRGRREPLAYVIGTQPFRDLVLRVGPGVLVPRPETEELVGLMLAALPSAGRALDVGTGSGALALALKKAQPAWQVEATDVSATALETARANAARLALEIVFHHGHLATHCVGPFQLVVANLPYVGETERGECDPELAFEPAEALFSGADGLDLIRAFIPDLRRLLAPDGSAWLEHGWRQGEAITHLASAAGLSCAILPDSAGKNRFARLTPAP